MSDSSHWTPLEAALCRYQFLHPGVTVGHERNAWDKSGRFGLESLSGIWLVSKLIRSVGSRFPMGPKQYMIGLFAIGMMIWSLRAYKRWKINTMISETGTMVEERWRKGNRFIPPGSRKMKPFVFTGGRDEQHGWNPRGGQELERIDEAIADLFTKREKSHVDEPVEKTAER